LIAFATYITGGLGDSGYHAQGVAVDLGLPENVALDENVRLVLQIVDALFHVEQGLLQAILGRKACCKGHTAGLLGNCRVQFEAKRAERANFAYRVNRKNTK